MKKTLLLLLVAFLGLATFAQERIAYLNGGTAPYGNVWRFNREGIRVVYDGIVDDTLKSTNQDTIQYIIQIKGNSVKPLHFYANFYMKGLTATDTTVNIESYYKIDARDDWTTLTATVTSAVTPTTGVSKAVTTLGVVSDYTTTTTVAAYDAVYDARILTVAAYNMLTDTAGLAGYPADSISVPSYTITAAADTLEVPAQTYTVSNVQNPVLHGRYLMFYVILNGDDSSGTGVEIEEIAITFDVWQ